MPSFIFKLQLWFDIRRFKKNQANYFLYLSHLLRGSEGQLTVHSVFSADLKRYGLGHYRGRLAQYWLRRYENNGGDLAATWHAVLSADAWLLIRASQARGDKAFLNALDALAMQLDSFQKMQKQIMQLLWPAILALSIFFLMCILIPAYTVPQLLNTFSSVPEDYYGSYTLNLIFWSNFNKKYGLFLILSLFFLLIVIRISLSRYHGRFRYIFDFIEPWKSYKEINAYRLLSLLSLLLNNSAVQLRLAQAVQMINYGENAWFNYQANHIQERILQGSVGANSFDTMLLSKDIFWFLQDMEQSQGIEKSLYLTTTHQYEDLINKLPIKATFWRWFLLLSCVFAMLLIGGWHYIVIDELRRALLMLYAN